ncbi:cell division protein FtsW, lipid II flippase [Peptoniphilus asaccharolyticus DSM 20463]|uniref:Cell division protein FtsW, lipid II flippase n=1 Tax=Peptoniphilus asaccharolyticus DSM 20463 TaxID=573058 RepID=A0A1W1UVN6_PEPAS|nr:FtsW/RodA/SpoVE family cell cycle protein [Peptoniphilus asaccharolyticus]MBL7575258.1 FtsW/RodA/SpoVE family cell cycle protein [Peptoniphilus asaccharolyticus]SMB85110.1 cell division protein FtsW, lipid II flippase [Peptoniphilus asaccharolyticus DSM 20463]
MITKVFRSDKPRNLLLVFEILAVLLLFFFNNQHVDKYIVILFFGLISVIYISNFILGRISTGDNYIFLIVSMLLTIGILTIYRLNPDLGLKQLVWSLVGILIFYITYFVMRALRKIENWTYFYVAVSIMLFLITLLFGVERGGSKNWIKLSESVLLQPTELTKIVLVFLIASYYTEYQYKIPKKFKYKSILLMGTVYLLIGLLFIQKDLGTAVIFLSIFTGIQFIYEEDRKMILLNLLLVVIGGVAGYFLFRHVRVRIGIWLDPWNPETIYKSSAQIVQSLFAIAEGGFFGTGIGLGHPKLVPVGTSDFIFPVICEEMGIFAGIGIIMLFLLLAYRAVKISIRQEYKFYRILAIGIGILFAVQCFLNIGGVIKLIPMTGLTLPFVSYGGSSMISSFIALGVLQVTSEDMSYKYEG